MPVIHAKVSAKADAPDTELVRPSNWNDAHVVNVDLTTEVSNVLGQLNGGTGYSDWNDFIAEIRSLFSSADTNIIYDPVTGVIQLSGSPSLSNLVISGEFFITGANGVLYGSSGDILSGGTTSNVPEGSNLYFTDARAIAAIGATPQFTRIGLGGAADATYPLLVYDRFGVRTNGANTAGMWCDSSAGTKRAFIGLETDSATPRAGIFNSAWNFLLSPSGVTLFGATLEANYCLQLPNSATQKAKANAWDTYSDRRLKENIRPLSSPLEKICSLNGYNHTYTASAVAPALKTDSKGEWTPLTQAQLQQIDKDTSVNYANCMADEVWEHIPELATLDKDGVPTSVNYGGFVPYLIESIKVLNSRIAALEQQLNG